MVFGPHGPPLHGFPHVPALVRTHQDFPGASVVSLAHEDLHLLALDVIMSLLVAGRAASPLFQQGGIPPVAPQSSPLAWMYGTTPLVMPQGVPPVMPQGVPLVLPQGVGVPPLATVMPHGVGVPPLVTPALVAMRAVEPLKLCELKDPKAFLDNWDLIQYYLCLPEFSTCWMDNALVMDSSHLEASRIWEDQLRLAVKEGLLCYLFENKGNVYSGHSFEMLAALSQHCHPDLVANAFTLLLLLFNNVQGNDEPILQYQSRFDGIIMELSHCKVAIPQILMVMLFLRGIHSCYSDLLDQFCTHFKSIEMASIDSIVGKIVYHGGFTVHERKGAKPSSSVPCVPTAASANTDWKGTVWQTPFQWLSKATSKKAIRTKWTCALAGTGICPICHCEDKPWHVPTKCPLLKDLNLQLEVVPSGPAAQPADNNMMR
jgi:hypothetical protein